MASCFDLEYVLVVLVVVVLVVSGDSSLLLRSGILRSGFCNKGGRAAERKSDPARWGRTGQ